MKVLLICAIFCVTWRISTLQPIVKRQVYDYDEGDDDDSNEQESDDELVVPAPRKVAKHTSVQYYSLADQNTPYIPQPSTEVEYYCANPERYFLHGKNCYLKKVRARKGKINPSPQNPCPYGSYLIGNSCHPYNDQNTKTGHTIQNPPYNPYNSQTSQIIPFTYSPPPTPPPICPPGYQFSGGMCYYIYTSYNPYNSYTIYSG